MNTKEWIIVIFLILILSLIVSTIVVNTIPTGMVYFEEKQVCLLPISEPMSYCNNLCIEKGYEGTRGGGNLGNNLCSCTCYKLVR